MSGSPEPLRNLPAEAALLGLYLTQPDALVRLPVVPSAFADAQHRWIFQAIGAVALRGERPDFATVSAELQRQQAGISSVVVFELAEHAPPTLSRSVQEAVIEAQQRRALREAGRVLQALAADVDTAPLDALEQHHEYLARETRTVGAGDAPLVADRVGALLDAARDGQLRRCVPTGLADLDALLGGWPRGELSVIAARTGVGKSALAGHVALDAAAAGRGVVFCSAEMPGDQLTLRWIANRYKIDLRRILTGGLSSREADTIRAQRLPRVRLCDKPAMTTQDVSDLVARLAGRETLDLVVVDHLHHLADETQDAREPRHLQLGRMTRRLVEVARRHDVAVVLCAQLNRGAEGEVPTLAHLRESGAIEELAAVVALLHVPEDTPRTLHVRVEKHRQGARGAVRLAWQPEWLRFENHARDEEVAA